MKSGISLITTMIFCILFLHTPQAKSQSNELHYGLQAGINFQTIYGQDEKGISLDDKIILAYHFGVNAEMKFTSEFYIQTGILFTIKGSKIKVDSTETKIPRISSAELPLNIIYKSILGNGHLLLGFGPYFSLGIGGSTKYEETSTGHLAEIKFENTVTATAPLHVDYFRPLDIGANLMIGFEFLDKLSVQLNAQMGFSKINPVDERIFNDKTSQKNIGFGISMGYIF